MRDAAVATVLMAVAALLWAPGRPRIALGVLGGGGLVGLSIWALSGLAAALMPGARPGEKRPVSRGVLLVKFFTRHGILGLAAYVMMARLHLDPIGMLVGVTSIVIAAAIAATRQR